jgi:hypothetical protein
MYRTICLLAVAAATLVGDVAPAQAQIRFGIGFGSGGVYPYGGYGYPYGGYGYPYGGYGYGSWWNMDPNLYRRPSSNYGYSRPQTRTIYVQPQRVGDGQPIKIFTLADAGTPLSYAIDGTEFTLQPGESQLLTYDRPRTITFDRGGDFGTGEYELTSGQYWFELTDKGWELFHDADVSKLTKQSTGAREGKNPLPTSPSPLPVPKGQQF